MKYVLCRVSQSCLLKVAQPHWILTTKPAGAQLNQNQGHEICTLPREPILPLESCPAPLEFDQNTSWGPAESDRLQHMYSAPRDPCPAASLQWNVTRSCWGPSPEFRPGTSSGPKSVSKMHSCLLSSCDTTNFVQILRTKLLPRNVY